MQRQKNTAILKKTSISPTILHHSTGKFWLAALLLAVATIVVYAPVRHHEFIDFDDGLYVYDNKQVQEGLSFDAIQWAFSLVKENNTYWHPVAWLSHMLDCQLFGLNPGAHHLSNLFFHLLNVLLLFLALLRMTGALWNSAFVAALFALHPVNVDSVAWIAERKNLLSTTFWMLTMLTYAHYAARPSVLRYGGVTAVFTIGLMTKPMLVTLPCALLLLDFWPLGRFRWFRNGRNSSFAETSTPRLILEKIPLLALSFGAMALSFISLQKNSQILNEIVHPMGLRIANALVSYWHYLWKMVWPANLAVFYPFPKEIPLWQPVTAGIALIAATGLVIAYSRKKPYLATGWFWYLGTLTPVIGIIQGGLWPQIADRWAYVPYVGVFILIAWFAEDLAARQKWRRRILTASAIAILVVFSTLTTLQLKHWQTTESLFQHALHVTEQNFLAHLQIGHVLKNQKKPAEAIREYKKSLDIIPDYAKAHEALGDAYIALKSYEKAIFHYHKALLRAPAEIDLYYKIGNSYTNTGQYVQALHYYQDIITFAPDDPKAYNNMGAVELCLGNLENARQNFINAIAIQPDYAEAVYNLGLAASKAGNTDEAVVHFQRAVALNPNYGDAHNSLAQIFFEAGNLDQARVHFNHVARITPDDPTAHYNLGVISYSKGQAAEAARHFLQALKINPHYEKARTALQSLQP